MPFGYKYHENVTEKELLDVYNEFSKSEGIFTFEESKKPPCISCAVIGTGGIMNGSNMGKEIDSHDMVFRVNHAIRKGYERDVGKKLTHYVFFDRSLIYTKADDIPNDQGVTYLFVPCRKQDLYYIMDVIGKGKSRRPPKLTTSSDNIRILHPDFVRYVHKIWENTTSFRPTTGAIMVMTAMHAGCDHLSLYGMGYTHDYSMHYYDKEYVKYQSLKGSHDFKREIAIWARLHQDGIARWYKRDVAEFT
ncbi:alpha-N-acetylgalactosaminide alpha-2,6-sialyltransferase 2-like [Ptychodera flava]|uniref:alpha-N-acetylgalactosaminide alpha-2,6-sialyltransferase 2-like n=1 Tax=Ptychodera flava TaxID=63121 RepID=UPI00396A1223